MVENKTRTLKTEIKITIKKNEVEQIIFPAKVIEMYAMANIEIPFKVIPEGASTDGIKWEIDNYSPVQVIAPGVLYSNQLASSTELTVTLPNGNVTHLKIKVVSRGLLDIKAPLDTRMKIFEGQESPMLFTLLPLGETYEGVVFMIDNPIVSIDRDGVVSTYVGKTGIANITVRSKENMEVQLKMKVEVLSFTDYIFTDVNMKIAETGNNLYTGNGHINVWRYFKTDVKIKNFTLYDSYGKVLFSDRSTYTLDKSYYISYDRVSKPYVEYDLIYQGKVERKRADVSSMTATESLD